MGGAGRRAPTAAPPRPPRGRRRPGPSRAFPGKEAESVAEEHERNRRFPTDVVARLGPMGLLGIPYPEEEGGAGLDTLAYAIAVEELSRVWGSLGIIVAAHTSLGCGPLHLAGTPEQKERFLVPMAQGRVLGAYGLTEPEAGSDSGGTRTAARHEDGPGAGSWVIDGRKRFITNAGQAGTYVITARTRARPPRGLRPRAPAVRPSHRYLPGRRLHDRRHGHGDRRSPGHGLARRLAQGPGPRTPAPPRPGGTPP